MRTIQEVAKEEGVLPLLHGVDSVHGANYVQVCEQGGGIIVDTLTGQEGGEETV